MLKQNKKKNILIRFFLSPYFFTFACLIVLAVIIYPVYQNASRRYEVDKEISDLSKQIAGLESGNDDLKKLKVYLESDQFAEKSARLDLGLKMKGEQVAVVDSSGLSNMAADQSAADADSAKNKNSNPLKWWNYFFGQ